MLYALSNDHFLKYIMPVLVSAWVPVLRVTCVLDLTDQKRYVTNLNKFGWSLCLETLQKLFQALIYTKPYNYLSKIFKQTSLFQFCFVLLFSEQEVTIHGLGSAINRAINLALQLEQRGQGTVEVTWKNSFFKLLIGSLLERGNDTYERARIKHRLQVTDDGLQVMRHRWGVKGHGSPLPVKRELQKQLPLSLLCYNNVIGDSDHWHLIGDAGPVFKTWKKDLACMASNPGCKRGGGSKVRLIHMEQREHIQLVWFLLFS